jgi:hypothetical protein
MAEEEPKIHVDSDWKAQAQQEKQKLAEQEKAKQGEGQQGDAGQQGQMPPANFETLMSTMATQALFALGAIPDPRTGQASLSPELAKHHIDMLGVLEEKTEGNLTDEEAKLLSQTLHELRQRYVEVTEAIKQQAQQQGQAGVEGGQGQQGGQSGAGGAGQIYTG